MHLSKLIPFAMIAVGVFGGSSLSHAQVPELFIPVDGKEQARVLKANEYFIKKGAYFTRRYRIVRVNTDVLFDDKHPDLNLSLFDDISLSITRDKLITQPFAHTFAWHGHYTATPFTPDEFAQLNAKSPVDTSKLLYGYLFGVEILGTEFVFDKDPADAEPLAGMRYDREAHRIVHKAERLSDKVARGTRVYSVHANLDVSAILHYLRTYNTPHYTDPTFPEIRIRIRSLPMDRRYCVVYELDPDRAVTFGLDEPPESPEQREKLRQYHEFLRSLGPDPRKAKTN